MRLKDGTLATKGDRNTMGQTPCIGREQGKWERQV